MLSHALLMNETHKDGKEREKNTQLEIKMKCMRVLTVAANNHYAMDLKCVAKCCFHSYIEETKHLK